jgi:hypothetical protein
MRKETTSSPDVTDINIISPDVIDQVYQKSSNPWLGYEKIPCDYLVFQRSEPGRMFEIAML